MTVSQTSAAWCSAMRRVAAAGAGVERELRRAIIAGVAENVLPLPSLREPVASGQMPEVWLSNCFTVIFALRGSLSGWAHGMNWNAGIVERHLPRRLALLAQFRCDRQHRGADRLRDRGDAAGVGRALLPRSTSSTMCPRRMTTAAKFRSSLASNHVRNSASFSGSIPAIERTAAGSSSLRHPPIDSGGGKYPSRHSQPRARSKASPFKAA